MGLCGAKVTEKEMVVKMEYLGSDYRLQESFKFFSLWVSMALRGSLCIILVYYSPPSVYASTNNEVQWVTLLITLFISHLNI